MSEHSDLNPKTPPSVTEQPRQSPLVRPKLENPEPDDGDDLPKRDAHGGMTRHQAALLSELHKLHEEVLGAAKTTLTKAIRIGEILSVFKEDVGHGYWLRWLEVNVHFTERTARNYIRVYEHRTELKSENVSDLTYAYRLLAEPMDATEDQATTDANEVTEANQSTGDTQSKEEATEDQESAKQTEGGSARKTKKKSAKTKSEKPKANKAKTTKGQAKKFKAMRERVPDEWVVNVEQALNGLVEAQAAACGNDPVRMLGLADVLRKCATKIEAALAENSVLAA